LFAGGGSAPLKVKMQNLKGQEKKLFQEGSIRKPYRQSFCKSGEEKQEASERNVETG